MTIENYIIILSIILIGILVNILVNRDKTYLVLLKDVKTNLNFTLIAKSLSKRKVYELVSKYLMKKGLPFVIIDITNTAVLDNNSIICLNIDVNDNEIS